MTRISVLLAGGLSHFGTHLLTLLISAHVYTRAESLIAGAAVFVAATVPAAVASGWIGRRLDTLPRRPTAVSIQLLAALLSIGVAWVAQADNYSFALLLLGLSVRASVAYGDRALYLDIIKTLSAGDPAREVRTVTAYFMGTYVAIVFAGAFLYFIPEAGLLAVAAIDATSFVLAGAVLAVALSHDTANERVAEPGRSRQTESPASTPDGDLVNDASVVAISQIVFLSFYHVYVLYGVGRGEIRDVGLFQIAAALGITGATVMKLWVRGAGAQFTSNFATVLGIATAAGLTYASPGAIGPAAGAFFFVNLAYEIVWINAMARLSSRLEGSRVRSFQYRLGAIASLLTGVTSLVASWLLERGANGYVALLVLALGCVLLATQRRLLSWGVMPT